MVGGDQGGTEVQPNPDPELAYLVHQELIMKNGIFNLESLTLDELARDGAYEFLFVFTPVRFRGARAHRAGRSRFDESGSGKSFRIQYKLQRRPP